ncbi:MAG: hydroxyacid dehydrogenase, partial [Clostridia bacterium]
MKSIVVLDQKTLGDDISLDILKKHGQLTSYEQTLSNEVESRIKNAEIIILNKVKLNKENLKAAKKLKLICLLATGYNNIDTQFCKENGIAVCNVAGYSTNSVCQHT